MSQARIERMQNDARISGYGKIVILTAAAAVAVVAVAVTGLSSGQLAADAQIAEIVEPQPNAETAIHGRERD